jgi:hypothetical protein
MADDLTPTARDLYERDYLAWTDQQAALLRARGANALDYDNLAEEIEDLGKAEYYGCESRVERIIEHLLKLEFVHSPRDRAHWRGEVTQFRLQLQDRLSGTIVNRLKPRLPTLFDRQIKLLVRRELLNEPALVRVARPDGYMWDQITDEEWYPVPPSSD